MLKSIRYPLATLVIAAAASCSEPAAPVPASAVAVTATTIPAAVVATAVSPTPTFEVRTASGKVIKNIPVSVSVTSGGGTLTNAAVKTTAGSTPIGTWTLGTASGTQSVTVTVLDFPPIVFTIQSTAGAAVGLQVVEGNLQRAPELGAIPNPIRVRVVDTHGNGVPNITVNWAVDAGGGALSGAAASVTNALGVATAPTWTVGLDGSGEQGLTATVAGIVANVRFTAAVQDPPASITIDNGAPATVVVGSAIGSVPTFVVRDADGNALSGIPVSVTVTAGGGSLVGAPSESMAGPTPIGAWTVGTTPGAQTVSVVVAGIPSGVITTTSVVGPPSSLLVIQGGGQAALAGTAVATAIRVRVRDIFNNPIPNANVGWLIVTGGGSLVGESSMADGAGEATAPAWTLGRLGGPQSILAFSGSAQLVIAAVIQTLYPLELRYNGAPPAAGVQEAITNAVNRIRATIVGELSPAIVTAESTPGACVAGVPIAETVPTNGIIIYATVEPIDGAGGTLGSAGPCYIRNSGAAAGPSLTVIGRMRFDSADLDNMLAQGTLESVILHEMLHIIGIGTLWGTLGLRTGTAPQVTPFFTGNLAKMACINDNGGGGFCGGGVPIEDCQGLTGSCGGGTINSHWKESVFRVELMTGFASPGLNPFSKMTIQSLADMGYTVNINTFDAYTVPAPSLMALLQAPSVRLSEPTAPIGVVTESGRVEPIIRPPNDQ